MQNKFKKIWSRTLNSLKFIGSDADRDWHILFFTFFGAMVLIFVWNIFNFVYLQGESATPPQIEKEVTLINKDTLDKVLADFDERAGMFESFRTEKPQIADPAK